MAERDIAVVGYGTAGQAAAVLLARDGHRVQVFERAPVLGPVGAGFLLQPTGLQVLWELGLLDAALTHGRPVHRLYGETPCGRAVMDMRYAGLAADLYGLGMQRGALFTLLAQALPPQVPVHCGRRIVEVETAAGRLRDEHGHWHGPFDLIVAADGAGSQLRGLTGSVRLDAPYPWGALWCLVAQEDWAWSDQLRQRYVSARKMIGLLPVGTRPGDATPRLSFFWSLPASDFDGWQQRGLPAWREEVARLWPEAEQRLHAIGECAQLARASYRDTVMRRWHCGRLVLAGDAAHAMSPQLGQGVNMALMDALALRDALRAEALVATALHRYQRQRQAHVGVYQFWSRWLTPLFQSERDTVARLRDIAFLPLGKLPGGRGHMLRVLSGTQHGLLGKLELKPEFLAALVQGGQQRESPGEGWASINADQYR
ncbi:FAD-dependent oxidoreductase [Pseudoxanthomonas wuyuanensis]|uniref:2-polyprenyl-6-methoxyphenol hydroxylase n=1 Tax=Pseudoxanthomonas wuyuanensis TaxID=1073196 RepID=A0A286CVI6_9GAMM|nr:NAD(P)/FAD-dependent oxidoreductase [Pseudoxanthomonas wuyuanensis]KAF1721307.1 FAD-dependent monooxygenase [Pseudoxanthomonas wuyuanensis]SOD50428.1 2-polyprenyl-6-methoxyphenol hydroxylase [Pseudoxanthomonas wuyuanensis]